MRVCLFAGGVLACAVWAYAQPAPVPPGVAGTISISDLAEARKPRPPRELGATPGVKDFDLRGNVRTLYGQVTRQFALEAVFDRDLEDGTAKRFHVEGADYRAALEALAAQTGTFVVPVNERRLLVAADNPQKRLELEQTISVVIPIPDSVGVQDTQELATSIRSTLDLRRLVVDTEKKLVLLRDVTSKVHLAQALFAQLQHPRAQVSIELQLLTTTQDHALHYGLSLPASFPIVNFGLISPFVLPPVVPSGVGGFLGLGGGATFLGIGLTSARLFASVQDSLTKNVYDSNVAAADGQPATLKVGTKYPVLTNGYFGNTSGTGKVFAPPPTVEFEDLGLTLKITPHVHSAGDVTLDVEAAFKLLTGQAANGIPVIANREYKSTVRLREGQAAVLAGMLSAGETRTIAGLAGVSSIPVLGVLLRENTTDRKRDETLIVLTPHIVRAPAGDIGGRGLLFGSETRPISAL